MVLTDTHAHLYSDQFDEDRDDMVSRALEADVKRLFLPNIEAETYQPMMDLCAKYPKNCFPMIGLHPCSVQEDFEKQLEDLHAKMGDEKFYGIGETGLDLYWDQSTLEWQQEALKIQIGWAKENNLPIILHCRDAFYELLNTLESLNDDNLKGIFHCFTGNEQQAERVLELGGFKLGIGGIVTFKKADLPEVVKKIALEHIVLETDSPYLAPHPKRGKRNESLYLVEVAKKVAEIHEMSIEELAKITTNNSKEIFGI